MKNNLVKVLLPRFLPEPLTYAVQENMQLVEGDFVKVHLGSKVLIGVIWQNNAENPENYKIKPVLAKLGTPPMSPALRKFIDWVTDYNVSSSGMVLKMAMSSPKALEDEKQIVAFRLVEQPPLPVGEGWGEGYKKSPLPNPPPQAGEGINVLPLYNQTKNIASSPEFVKQILGRSHETTLEFDKSNSVNDSILVKSRPSPSRQRVIDLLQNSPPLTANEISDLAAVSKSVIKGLLDFGVIEEVFIEPRRDVPQISKLELSLSPHQKIAADDLCQKVAAKKFSSTLLDGVTGSGKTEVYFSAIEEAFKKADSQVLIMLPEIALTAQIVQRFQEKFCFAPTQWHSALTVTQKEKNWREIAHGRARLLIGARSALFLPYKNLRLIIVDEEHDGSYKQEEGVIYHARDMAVVRASLEKCPIILASATPSIETVENVNAGKYSRLELPSRFGEAVMPDIKIVDMRKEKLKYGKWLSNLLKTQLADNIANGKQSMLFLNRRGYAPLILCKECDYRFKCPDCSSWLVEHKSHAKIMCHQCGFTQKRPEQCPDCHKEDSLVSCGPGVERIAEEVAEYFPKARICQMTADSMTNQTQASDMINAITNGDIDIIIGTQIIAKGYHFPHLTHVGVIDADLGLEGGDLRASEQTYQLLQQVAGRAGREKQKGTVIMQSYMPDNSVMKSLCSGDRDDFINNEIQSRKKTKMPPYARLAAIIISGKQERIVAGVAKAIVKAAPLQEEIRVLGPVPATIYLLRGNFRYRILIKTSRNINIQKWLNTLLAQIKAPSSVMIKVDIDPYSFM